MQLKHGCIEYEKFVSFYDISETLKPFHVNAILKSLTALFLKIKEGPDFSYLNEAVTYLKRYLTLTNLKNGFEENYIRLINQIYDLYGFFFVVKMSNNERGQILENIEETLKICVNINMMGSHVILTKLIIHLYKMSFKYPSTIDSFIRILKTAIVVAFRMDESAKNEAFKNMDYTKIISNFPILLSKVGDFHLQSMIIELLFKVMTSTNKARVLNLVFKNQTELIDKFNEISVIDITKGCRNFLNIFNPMIPDKEVSSNKNGQSATLPIKRRVFSFDCFSVCFGDILMQIIKFQDNVTQLWLDINIITSSLSFNVAYKEGNQERWESMEIFKYQISSLSVTKWQPTIEFRVQVNISLVHLLRVSSPHRVAILPEINGQKNGSQNFINIFFPYEASFSKALGEMFGCQIQNNIVGFTLNTTLNNGSQLTVSQPIPISSEHKSINIVKDNEKTVSTEKIKSPQKNNISRPTFLSPAIYDSEAPSDNTPLTQMRFERCSKPDINILLELQKQVSSKSEEKIDSDRLKNTAKTTNKHQKIKGKSINESSNNHKKVQKSINSSLKAVSKEDTNQFQPLRMSQRLSQKSSAKPIDNPANDTTKITLSNDTVEKRSHETFSQEFDSFLMIPENLSQTTTTRVLRSQKLSEGVKKLEPPKQEKSINIKDCSIILTNSQSINNRTNLEMSADNKNNAGDRKTAMKNNYLQVNQDNNSTNNVTTSIKKTKSYPDPIFSSTPKSLDVFVRPGAKKREAAKTVVENQKTSVVSVSDNKSVMVQENKNSSDHKRKPIPVRRYTPLTKDLPLNVINKGQKSRKPKTSTSPIKKVEVREKAEKTTVIKCYETRLSQKLNENSQNTSSKNRSLNDNTKLPPKMGKTYEKKSVNRNKQCEITNTQIARYEDTITHVTNTSLNKTIKDPREIAPKKPVITEEAYDFDTENELLIEESLNTAKSVKKATALSKSKLLSQGLKKENIETIEQKDNSVDIKINQKPSAIIIDTTSGRKRAKDKNKKNVTKLELSADNKMNCNNKVVNFSNNIESAKLREIKKPKETITSKSFERFDMNEKSKTLVSETTINKDSIFTTELNTYGKKRKRNEFMPEKELLNTVNKTTLAIENPYKKRYNNIANKSREDENNSYVNNFGKSRSRQNKVVSPASISASSQGGVDNQPSVLSVNVSVNFPSDINTFKKDSESNFKDNGNNNVSLLLDETKNTSYNELVIEKVEKNKRNLLADNKLNNSYANVLNPSPYTTESEYDVSNARVKDKNSFENTTNNISKQLQTVDLYPNIKPTEPTAICSYNKPLIKDTTLQNTSSFQRTMESDNSNNTPYMDLVYRHFYGEKNKTNKNTSIQSSPSYPNNNDLLSICQQFQELQDMSMCTSYKKLSHVSSVKISTKIKSGSKKPIINNSNVQQINNNTKVPTEMIALPDFKSLLESGNSENNYNFENIIRKIFNHEKEQLNVSRNLWIVYLDAIQRVYEIQPLLNQNMANQNERLVNYSNIIGQAIKEIQNDKRKLESEERMEFLSNIKKKQKLFLKKLKSKMMKNSLLELRDLLRQF